MYDTNDLVIAEVRLVDFSRMLGMAADNWDVDKPVKEFQSIVSTACHIYRLLLRELSSIIDGLEADTFQNSGDGTAAQAQRAMDIDEIPDSNMELAAANSTDEIRDRLLSQDAF